MYIFHYQSRQEKKFNYLIELLVEDENVDFLNAIILIEDSSVKNVRRSSSRKNTYLKRNFRE